MYFQKVLWWEFISISNIYRYHIYYPYLWITYIKTYIYIHTYKSFCIHVSTIYFLSKYILTNGVKISHKSHFSTMSSQQISGAGFSSKDYDLSSYRFLGFFNSTRIGKHLRNMPYIQSESNCYSNKTSANIVSISISCQSQTMHNTWVILESPFKVLRDHLHLKYIF